MGLLLALKLNVTQDMAPREEKGQWISGDICALLLVAGC